MSSTPKTVLKGSQGLTQLLQERGFIELLSATVAGTHCCVAEYGPLGTLLRHNILKQWWDTMVATQTNVFPVQSPFFKSYELQDLVKQKSKDSLSDIRGSLQKDCVNKFPHILKLTNGRLPFSIASVGTCFSETNKSIENEETDERKLLLGSSFETKLMLQNYIAPSSAHAIHDFWLQTRLSWWKKFSRSPEHFSVAPVTSTSSGVTANNADHQSNGSGESCMAIMYKFPWGQEIVEFVSHLNETLHKQMPQHEMERCTIKLQGKKTFLPSCIECSTSIELAMGSWLLDAYQERHAIPSGKKRARSQVQQVLQLHQQLSPYQVSLVSASPSPQSSSSSSPMQVELRYICDSLEKDFKKAGISIFNASNHGGSLDAHFRRNDQLGVLYTVIIDQTTVADGLVNTRCRNTQVKLTSHISSLVREIVRNLNSQLE